MMIRTDIEFLVNYECNMVPGRVLFAKRALANEPDTTDTGSNRANRSVAKITVISVSSRVYYINIGSGSIRSLFVCFFFFSFLAKFHLVDD